MAWLDGWDKRRIKFTVDETKIDTADLTWFRVIVTLSSTQMVKVFAELTSDANRFKIAFTKADGTTELYAEIERWDTANQKVIIHVSKYDWVIFYTENTDFYMYYDIDHADNIDYIGDRISNISIDVGSACIDRAVGQDGNYTFIDLANPVDYTGKITNVAIYAVAGHNMTSVKVATFYSTGGNNYTARDVSADLGTVVGGSVQNFAVNLNVVAGDVIGIYFDAAGWIELSTSLGSGIVYLEGDQTACVDETFTLLANYAISLYGIGGTALSGVNVWDTNVKMIQHMVDKTTSTVLDSTSNANNGTKKGAGEPASGTGKIGLGQTFDGANDYINVASSASLNAITNFTLSLWCKGNTDSSFFISKFADANVRFYGYCVATTKKASICVKDGTPDATERLESTSALSNTEWSQLTFVANGTTIKLYFNGVEEDTSTLAYSFAEQTGRALEIGGTTFWGVYWNGGMDEVQLSSVARTAGWIKANYHSENDTLIAYGSEEVGVITQSLVGILTVSGIITNKTNKNLTGILTSTGDITNSITKLLSGVITFAGDLAAELVAEFETFYKSIEGTLVLTGKTVKKIIISFSGILELAGSLVNQTRKMIEGIVTLTGNLINSIGKVLNGMVGFSGTLIKGISISLVGTLDFIGNIAKAISISLLGSINFTGLTIRKFFISFIGSLSFIGAISKIPGKFLTGVLSLSGITTNLIMKVLNGVLTFTGTVATGIAEMYYQAVAGVLNLSGTITKKAIITLSGVFNFSGYMVKKILIILVGALNFSGLIINLIGKVLNGIIDFTGSLTNKIGKILNGTLTFTGELVKRISISLLGVSDFIGSVTTGLANFYYQSVTGILDFTGSIVKKTSISLSGVFNFTGIITKLIDKLLTGIIELSGMISRLTNKLVSGIVNFTGDIIGSIIYAISLTGIVSFTGETNRVIGKLLEGTITFAGSILKRISIALRGVLDFVGSLVAQFMRIFTYAELSIETTDTEISIINDFSSLSIKDTDTEISIINDYSDISIKDTDTEISISN